MVVSVVLFVAMGFQVGLQDSKLCTLEVLHSELDNILITVHDYSQYCLYRVMHIT